MCFDRFQFQVLLPMLPVSMYPAVASGFCNIMIHEINKVPDKKQDE